MDIVEKTVKDIIDLRIQGASEVRKRAVSALVESALGSKAKKPELFRKEFTKNIASLYCARPTEPELRTALRIIKRSVSEKGLTNEQMKQKIMQAAKEYEKNRKEALERISRYGAELIHSGSTIMTICHSRSVVDTLLRAKSKIKHVYCLESRPLYQGRVTANELSCAGIDTTILVDNAASTVLKKCDYFLSGADALLADGDVVNKIGTNQISILAKHFDVLHYVAASTHKFEAASFFGKAEPIEQRALDEVWDEKSTPTCTGRGKIKAINPAFDRTDSSTIGGIICEMGIFPPQVLASKLFDELELEKHEHEFLKL